MGAVCHSISAYHVIWPWHLDFPSYFEQGRLPCINPRAEVTSMVAPHTGHVCRGFLSSLQSATSSNARSCSRAIRNHNVRNFSRSSIAYAATTNYARPTTTARTASTTAASKSSPTPAAFKSAAPAAKPSTTTATPKPATTKSTTETAQTYAPTSDTSKPRTVRSLAQGLADEPLPPAPSVDDTGNTVDWSSSFHGLSGAAFSQEAQDTLLEPISPSDVEIKPDGIIYLPEIKYRRILNKAFGPGAWGLAPRGETIVTPKTVTREYGLVVHGRYAASAHRFFTRRLG
jgi:hypothetical protein